MKRAYRDTAILIAIGVVAAVEALTVGPHGTGWGIAGVVTGLIVSTIFILAGGYLLVSARNSSD